MTVRELKLLIIDNADKIAEILHKGKDVELRKSARGFSVAEVTKKVIMK